MQCGSEIDWERVGKRWVKLDHETRHKHDCINDPKHPLHEQYSDDNLELGKIQDSKVNKEIAKNTKMEQRITDIEKNQVSMDEELQKNKAETRIEIKNIKQEIERLKDEIKKLQAQ